MNGRNIINNKLLALACIAMILLVLAACGGSGGGRDKIGEPIGDNCGPTAIPENSGCRTIAVRVDEMMPTAFVEDGQFINLEVVLFKPLEPGRYPTAVFHHGSTGDGSDPSRFGLTFTSTPVVRYFVEQGWMVAFPQRRGRGRSGGLYDEGFKADRSSYSCEATRSLAGAARALEDLDAITDWIRQRADVDATRMLVAGTSRGGVLSLAHTAQRPDVYLGAINFVGGWIAEGCGDFREINRTLFVDAAAFPGRSLWLYGANDSFYSLAYSRSNHGAFTMAGGLGTMIEISRTPGVNGHFVINDPDLWAPATNQYLATLP